MFTILSMNDETHYADLILRLTIGMYVLLMGVGSLCLCLTLVIQGSLIVEPSSRLMSVRAVLAQTMPQTMTAADLSSLSQTHTAGQVFIALGLLGIVAALVALMVAFGLFIGRSWAYPATIGLNLTIIVLWLVVSLLEGEFSVPRMTMMVFNTLILLLLWKRPRQPVLLSSE